MFYGTFVDQSSVLRLIKLFTVTDLPIHAFFTICLGLPKFMQFAVCMYVCMYIYLYMYIYIYIYTVYIYIDKMLPKDVRCYY